MVVTFDNLSFEEQPRLILKTAGGTPLGVIGCATEVHLTLAYNELSVLEFSVPAYVDGQKVPYYDDIVGMRLIDIPEIGVFSLTTPAEIGDGATVSKHCSAYSLENEFTYKRITLPQSTYKFWDRVFPQETLIGIILELMPSWSVGYIPSSIADKYRTFEVINENCYSFIKNTIQLSYGCIIDFDTRERKINVRDIENEVGTQPVFISMENLARSIEISENTSSIVTRLDVNGADGLDIRDVNPTGTNKLINLDYFMTHDNFSQEIIDKYNAWETARDENERSYYVLSVEFSLITERLVTQKAKLTDLKHELVSLENQQAVIISAIAQAIKDQTDLNDINTQISAKKTDIDKIVQDIKSLEEERQTMLDDLQSIIDICRFESRFNENELIELDKYIRDGDLSDPSFVATDVVSFTDNGSGEPVSSATNIVFAGGQIETVVDANGKQIFTVKGGTVTSGDLKANVISAVCERLSSKRTTISIYMNTGRIMETDFPGGCVTFDGTADDAIIASDTTATIVMDGYRYFTLNATEFQRRSVAWDLYDYAKQIHNTLSRPTYSFTITSANFLSLEDYKTFRDHLRLGDKVYIQLPNEGQVIEPICTSVGFTLNKDIYEIELLFGNTYAAGSAEFKLADLLDQSIEQSKDMAINHNAYVSFKNSGASTGLQEFMQSALDVTKNAIMSSNNQAISLDGAGLRLRRYSDDEHEDYEDEQIWMNNNSIMMTRDGWQTAQMAIGKFRDPNVGQELWGIVGDAVYGTLLAGNKLIIESAKKDGNISVFRMDGDGCRLYNSDFMIVKTGDSDDKTFVMAMNPDIGMVMGKLGVLTTDEETGKQTLHEELANAWVDTDGNANFRGRVHATSLLIDNFTQDGQTISIEDAINYAITNFDFGDTVIDFSSDIVKHVLITPEVGIQVVGDDDSFFQVKNAQMGFFDSNGNALLAYNRGNMTMAGRISAESGYIGGNDKDHAWTIKPGAMYTGEADALRKPGGIYAGINGISVGEDFWVTKSGDAHFEGDITANSGLIGGWHIQTNYLIEEDGSSRAVQALFAGAKVYANFKDDKCLFLGSDGTLSFGTKFYLSKDESKIGGWIFDETKMYTGKAGDGEEGAPGAAFKDEGRMYLGSDGKFSYGDVFYLSEEESKIGGWSFDKDSLYTGDKDNPATYIKPDGIGFGDTFSVDVSKGNDGVTSSTLKLAGFDVVSADSSATYQGTIKGAGATSEHTKTSEIPYSYVGGEGTVESAKFTFTAAYHVVSTTSTALPTISGYKMSFKHNNSGIEFFAGDGSAIVPIGTGRLMGWDVVQSDKIVANTLSIGDVIATNVYIGNGVAATQQWVLETVGQALSIEGSIGSAISNAVTNYNTYVTGALGGKVGTNELNTAISQTEGKISLEAKRITDLETWKSGITIEPEAINLYSSRISGLEEWKSQFTVTPDNIAAAVKNGQDFAALNITKDKIDAAVTAGEKFANLSLTADQIYAAVTTVENSAVLNVSADKIAAAVTAGEKFADLSVTASEISAAVSTADRLAGITVSADHINSTVTSGNLISSINQTAESVTISASKIDLSGYVKMSEFNAVSGDVGTLKAGNFGSTTISAGVINGTYIGATGGITASGAITAGTTLYAPSIVAQSGGSVTCGSIIIGGGTMSSHSLTIGTASAVSYLSASDLSIDASNLPHTHSFSVDSNGVVTLGAVEVGTTPSSFNIADTEFFKNSVSASVYDRCVLTNDLAQNASGEYYYQLGATIFFKNGTSVEVPLGTNNTSSMAYINGKSDGFNNCAGTVLLSTTTANVSLDYGESMTIYAQYKNQRGGTVDADSVVVSAPSDRYNSGYSDGRDSVELDYPTASFNWNSASHTYTCSLASKTTDGSKEKLTSTTLTPTDAISYGRDSVYITKGTPTDRYVSSTGMYSVNIPYELSNDKSGTLTHVFSGDEAYDDGYSDGYEEGKNGVHETDTRGEPVYDNKAHAYSMWAAADLSNGKSFSWHVVTGTEAYDAGKNSVYISSHNISQIGPDRVITIKLSNGDVYSYEV